jgi:hypothetical protein
MTKAHRTLVAVFFIMFEERVLTCFKSSRDWKFGKKCLGMAFWGSGRYTMLLFDILPRNGRGELQNHIPIRLDQA